jgi:hypothetical protein
MMKPAVDTKILDQGICGSGKKFKRGRQQTEQPVVRRSLLIV